MLIGVQTGGVSERLGREECLKMIAEAGFKVLDGNIDHFLPGNDIREGKLTSIFDESEEACMEYVRPWLETAEKYGLQFGQLHAPFPTFVNVPETDEYLINALNKSIAMAGALKCPHIIVHPAFLRYNDALSPEEEWKLNIERYSALIPMLKKHNVICCLENMFTRFAGEGRPGKLYGACCSNPYEAAKYIDTLNEIAGEKRFAFCLDTGHALIVGADIRRTMNVLGSRIETLHIHDNDGIDDQHLAPYMGRLDWDAFIEGLKEIGYKGHLSFETFNVLNAFDDELMLPCMKLICATGEMFRKRIEA